VGIDAQAQKVNAVCATCGSSYIVDRVLAEETGPELARILIPSRRQGSWVVRSARFGEEDVT
jgi:hypothetical protein